MGTVVDGLRDFVVTVLIRVGVVVGLLGGGGAAIYWGASYGADDWRCLTAAVVSIVCFFILFRPEEG